MFDPYEAYMNQVKSAAGVPAFASGAVSALKTRAQQFAAGAQSAAQAAAPHVQNAINVVKAKAPDAYAAVSAAIPKVDELNQTFLRGKAVAQDVLHNAPRLVGKKPVTEQAQGGATAHVLGGAALGAAGMYVGGELGRKDTY